MLGVMSLLQSGRVHLGFLGAAEVDRFGNLNSTEVHGAKGMTRLPGSGGAGSLPLGMTAIDPVFKHPTAYMWSAGVQREIPFGFVVDVTYVGRRGLYLQRERDINQALHPVLDDIERRLCWRPKRELDLEARIYRVGESLLCLKEMEYLGQPQPGTIHERLTRLIDHLLVPLEQEWVKGQRDETTVGRVKKLRVAILPDMIKGEITEAERNRRWQHLADMYFAQQVSHYPPDYVKTKPTPERLLETVERFEEDMTDAARVHPPMTVTVEVGAAIPVSPTRERAMSEDPVIQALEQQLHRMLGIPT
jgi:hypothetical protein